MKNNRRNKKVRNYIIICAMLAIILSVSTYAWFIGLQDVKVNSFDVTIKAADSLRLSLDGVNFTDTLEITEAAVTTGLETTYTTNTNAWATNGLTPVSTIGEIDPSTSTMKLYEKASLTASPDDATAGGYRLLASRVDNYTTKVENFYTEASGYYVVFDLFVENSSGTEYYSERNILNEEAIYLLTDSSVTVASTGVEGTGIENSVRVGFAQIGRMIKGSGAAIQGATCATTTDITGICYTATIWEPNDTAHVQGAINWYSESCAVRNEEDLYDADSYAVGTPCKTGSPVANGTAYSTSAVAREVAISDYVDIYDGYYNTYTDTVSYGEWDGSPLYEVDYFTDTEKNLSGTSRPTFFTLAPNSLTKVRVYVWIEGQDIDNYDYAMAGKTISVNFGFTKERFETYDVNYNGPYVETDVTTITGAINQAKCEAIGGTFTNGTAEDNTDDVCTVSYGRFMRAATADEETYSASTFTISTTHKTDPNS